MQNNKETAQKFVDQLVLKEKITEDDIADMLVQYAEKVYGTEYRDLEMQNSVIKLQSKRHYDTSQKHLTTLLILKHQIEEVKQIPFYRIFKRKKFIDDITSKTGNL